MVTTALLGLLTALRHRADSDFDTEQKPYKEEYDIMLLSATETSAGITGAAVPDPFSIVSPEITNVRQ